MFVPMVPIEELGKALAILRAKHGKTQETVAQTAGITPSMISNYERGKEKPSLDSLWKILSAMDCSLIDLEAALRMAKGEPFPLRCENWRITIEADDYDAGAASPQPGELAEPSAARVETLSTEIALPEDAERYMLGMLRMMVGLIKVSETKGA